MRILDVDKQKNYELVDGIMWALPRATSVCEAGTLIAMETKWSFVIECTVYRTVHIDTNGKRFWKGTWEYSLERAKDNFYSARQAKLDNYEIQDLCKRHPVNN